MALPPEQINIKRRREEEPVETLYIQSELHQTKRRFTDFVFQRIPVSNGGSGSHGHGSHGDDSGSRPVSPSSSAQTAGAAGAPRRVLRTPRSVSSLNVLKGGARHATTPAGTGTGGASARASGTPLVRATSPGAEIREEKSLAAAKKEKEEKLRRALHSHSHSRSPAPSESPVPGSGGSGRNSANGSGRASPASVTSSSGKGPAHSLRRFQISKTGHPVNLHKSFDGGIQKRRGGGGGSDGVAVLVEKLRRKPHSRQVSMVDRLAVQAERNKSAGPSADGDGGGESAGGEPRPRKRPVVNQAEKKWREERKNAISAAKQHISQVMDRGENESDRLARDFEQIALELDGDQHMDEDVVKPASTSTTPTRDFSKLPKPPLKYQPRTPDKPRPANPPSTTQPAPEQEAEDENDDSDSNYVYDVYIRKPLPQPEPTPLSNPLTDLASNQDAWFRQNGIDTTRQDIGVIVITQEDEGYWENFVEEDEDEERWDDEDADSNAENNPANDYPDEELSWDDEDDDDDPTAMYRKYRHAMSDDEEFDFDDSASEGMGMGSGRRMGGFGYSHESDEEWY